MFTNDIIANFNELETSLYNYICQNSDKVAYMRIRELADETHVSTATILRFCRKLHCEGFSEFKVKLKMQLKENKKTIIKSSQQSVIEFFERTLKSNLEEKIKESASLVTKADNVIFIGIGSSGILAEYGARYFSSLGEFSLYIKDPHFPIHSKLRNNSVTIALSVSGENKFTVTHLNQLKQEGSTIISITNNALSTIAKISDINIPYYVTEEFFEESNITTQIPVVYILESVAREIHNLNQ
ncbi:RpiR family transcriptional regulator [Bacillus pseudomycoides]|uniref:MurR/RpiR family transcriptional regulator n=1 Tax=Bacillus pseudomycoides TaxID=64104 RepID=UPI000BED7C3A|nr:MurR/RpiR family transcriptional regulator [Bacillus pseudomycoides]PDY44177.1 RpiR family transcriptional regulator [Bacillus pseudomycoides]PEA80902.1 RpiR family transcriptional regulator [Bacillus pseudomycoides]PEK26331.1 RpiR family transcriptional regulator [Bacillus pseudomycoides]PEO23768.1 RpiR family transcriptional regulator [Bacillus pseudomycoides]PEP69311.1 RpiR family transcriptional regulator [Bacillus pseudomycoides]